MMHSAGEKDKRTDTLQRSRNRSNDPMTKEPATSTSKSNLSKGRTSVSTTSAAGTGTGTISSASNSIVTSSVTASTGPSQPIKFKSSFRNTIFDVMKRRGWKER